MRSHIVATGECGEQWFKVNVPQIAPLLFNSRGQIYEACELNTEANVRVHVARMTAYLWSMSRRRWELVIDITKFAGGAFR